MCVHVFFLQYVGHFVLAEYNDKIIFFFSHDNNEFY